MCSSIMYNQKLLTVRALFFSAALLCSQLLSAQSGKQLFDLKTLLFPAFATGKVQLKDGRTESTLMNYNTDAQNMVFVQGNDYMVLTNLETIDTIYLQDRKFLPVGNAVFELISKEGEWELLANYTAKRQPLTATADKSGTTQKTTSEVSNTVTNVYVGRNHRDNFAVQMMPQFWLRYKGKMYKEFAKKQLLRTLGTEQQASAESYLDKHPAAFERAEEMTELLHVIAQKKAS